MSLYACTGGKIILVCQRGLCMKGCRQSQWSIQEGVLHKAACSTVSMNFWELNMKQKVVRCSNMCSSNHYNIAGEQCDRFTLFSGSFLTRMRNYMPPAHKQLIQDISSQPSLRSFVQQQPSEHLKQAFHLCVTKLLALRSYHINVVSRFITVPAARARQLRNQSQDLEEDMVSRAPTGLEERGTGGSGIMSFLKTVRDQTKDTFLFDRSKEIKPQLM